MARARRAPDAATASPTLTEEQFDDLQVFYNLKTREARRRADAIKADYDAAREDVGSWYSRMHADLRYTRKEFEAMQADQDLQSSAFLAKEAKRNRLYKSGALKTGDQMELELVSDTVTDQAVASSEGSRAYLANKDPVPPSNIAPILHQEWLKGWHDEMERTAMRMGRAEAFITARKEPNADAEAVDLNEAPAEPEPGSPEAKKAERQSIARAKESLAKIGEGATSPTAQTVLDQARADEAQDRAEGHFEAPADELNKQRSRRAIKEARDAEAAAA